VHSAQFNFINFINFAACNMYIMIIRKDFPLKTHTKYMRVCVCRVISFGLSTEYFGFSEEELNLVAFDPV